jgi:peptide/nickel transport system substrate-binding protein
MKRFLCLIFGLLILCAVVAGAETKNPDTFILANYGNLRTLDPSVAYDVTSSQRLWNIYEPLVFFDGS